MPAKFVTEPMKALKAVAVSGPQLISAVASLAGQIWREHYVPIIGVKQVEYMLDKFQSQEAIAAQIENEGFIYYLLDREGSWAGYFAVVPKGRELFLSKFYIKKEARRQGLGRQAFAFIEEIARRNGALRTALVVNKRNSSIAAYERLGFVITDAVITDVGQGFVMDDYRMEKEIA